MFELCNRGVSYIPLILLSNNVRIVLFLSIGLPGSYLLVQLFILCIFSLPSLIIIAPLFFISLHIFVVLFIMYNYLQSFHLLVALFLLSVIIFIVIILLLLLFLVLLCVVDCPCPHCSFINEYMSWLYILASGYFFSVYQLVSVLIVIWSFSSIVFYGADILHCLYIMSHCHILLYLYYHLLYIPNLQVRYNYYVCLFNLSDLYFITIGIYLLKSHRD